MMIFTRFPIISAALFCLFTISLHSQSVLFQHLRDGEVRHDILEIADGYLIAGETADATNTNNDALLMKMDKTGQVIWKKRYGQSTNDGFLKIASANDGGFIAWGYTRNSGDNINDSWLVKLDDDGNLLWQKTVSKFSPSQSSIGNIIVMSDGYILSGVPLVTSDAQTFVIRVDNNGETLWSRQMPNRVQAQYAAGNIVYLTGSANLLGCWRSMDATTGDVIKSHQYMVNANQNFVEGHLTPEGNHLFAGNVADASSSLPDLRGLVQKVDPQGNVLWSKTYKIGNDVTGIRTSRVLADGSCVLQIIYTASDPAFLHAALVKIDPDGAVVWARHFGSDFTVYPHRVYQTADGGFITTGNRRKITAGVPDWDAFWMKTDSLGIVNGCCVENILVKVKDEPSERFDATVPTTPFENTIPYDLATSDTATLQIRAFCANEARKISRTIPFCPGESVALGDSTYNVPGVVTVVLPSATGGCDTIATYTLELLKQPTFSKTITFCANEPITLGDSTYSQSAIVGILLPSTTGGCDTLAVYTLELLPQPTVGQTIVFCSGDTVTLHGNKYTQSGTIQLAIPSSTGGCDTLATYTLEVLPQPTFSQTIAFCPGETVTIRGNSYTQPGIIQLVIPSTNGGCDTLATYTLQDKTANQPNTLQLNCPSNIAVIAASGATSAVVNYNAATATSNCPCPDLLLNLSSGASSGSTFPVGAHQICYRAEDACGYSKTCCFTVQVDEEEGGCDEKTNGCLQFQLMSIQRDAGQNWVYRIRITNQCSAAVTYAYLQAPSGVPVLEPANNSPYTGASGAAYTVRNPNFSPFYSVRFQPGAGGLGSGQSEVFRYVLPQQVDIDYIRVAVRLASGVYTETHLNTFFCPVGSEPANQTDDRSASVVVAPLQVIPNPAASSSTLFLTGIPIPDGVLVLQDVMGRVVSESPILENQVVLEEAVAAGMYFFKVLSNGGIVGKGKLSLF